MVNCLYLVVVLNVKLAREPDIQVCSIEIHDIYMCLSWYIYHFCPLTCTFGMAARTHVSSVFPHILEWSGYLLTVHTLVCLLKAWKLTVVRIECFNAVSRARKVTMVGIECNVSAFLTSLQEDPYQKWFLQGFFKNFCKMTNCKRIERARARHELIPWNGNHFLVSNNG